MSLIAFAAVAALQDFDAKQELARSLERLAAAKSYAYETTEERARAGGDGGGGRGGRDRGPTQTSGKYSAEAGLLANVGETKVVRKGEEVAYMDEAGFWQVAPKVDWEKLAAEQRQRRGPPQPGQGGVDWRALRFVGVTAPHTGLKDLAAQLESVDVEEKTESVGGEECVVVKAKLTKEGAEALVAGGGSGRGGFGRGGDQQQQDNVTRESSGTARFWLDDAGNVCQVQTVVAYTINWGGGGFSGSTTRTTKISGVDQTEVSIPAKAEAALQKAAEKKPADGEAPKQP